MDDGVPLDLAVIERRIAAVSAVRQVIHAIWALARAQLPLVEEAVAEASVYLDCVDEVVAALAGAPRPRPDAAGRAGALLVVLGPERSYCGALPRQILAQLPPEARLGLAGARLWEVAEQDARIAARVAFHVPGAVTHEEHEDIARAVADAVLRHAGGADVELLYPRDGGSALGRVTLLGGPRAPAPYPPETFSPIEVVLRAAVIEAITGRLAVGAAEALRSEVRARAAAAEAARRASDERLEQLRRAWTAARQDQITGEILEVVAGRLASVAGR